MEDLFDILDYKKDNAPLAERMRPTTLREFMGQSHICEEGSLFVPQLILESDKMRLNDDRRDRSML